MNKFEKLIEYIINDDDAKARELFHSIVVEKSRDIYESIMDEEHEDGHPTDAKVGRFQDEIDGEEECPMEGDEEGEEFDVAGDDGLGDDGEVGDDEFGGEEGDDIGSGESDDVVMNIDAKLDELLAKFDEIVGGGVEGPDDGGDEFGGDEFGGDEGGEEFGGDEGGEEFGGEEPVAEAKSGSGNPFAKGSGASGKSGSGKSGSGASGKSGSGKSGSGKSGSGKPFESKKSASELMREYVEKIGDIYGGQGDASEGDAVGATGKKTSVNTKPGSVGPGADFGGTEKNIAQGGTNEDPDGKPVPTPNNEYTKGRGEIKSGNRNVPGGKADKQENTGKKYETSKDAEGKLVGNDGSAPINKKSEIGGKVR